MPQKTKVKYRKKPKQNTAKSKNGLDNLFVINNMWLCKENRNYAAALIESTSYNLPKCHQKQSNGRIIISYSAHLLSK